MKAFRNINGNIVEIEVDIGLDGEPLLPPDTTIDPKPEPIDGHYLTVVGNKWVQIPITQEVISFDYKKQLALEKLSKYKEWYLNQPVNYSNRMFDADNKARERLSQAILMNSVTGYLPPFWLDSNNQQYAINSIDDIIGIATIVQNTFATRFYEMDIIRQQIIAAKNEEELDSINIPNVPNNFGF